MLQTLPNSTAVWSALLTLTALSCSELPSGPAESGSLSTRGVTLADWTADGYASASAQSAIRDIARTGANTLVLIITAYQDDPSGANLSADPQRTPTPAAVQTAMGVAATEGLDVVIKPHVDLESGAWRGTIAPTDVDAWFESYEAFVLPVAAFAEANGARCLVVGTELAGTIAHESHWRDLIEKVRGIFSGGVMYAASWDEASLVGFWDALDYVGVDFYAPVTARADASRLEILEGWQEWMRRLEILHKLAGRPVVLTEIGYRSVDEAG
ncbi:MAG: hypothetical protein IH969_10410, partial [Candidatus Krumholzibacteriota bacterium]|nr:hypothetical protein [Candidatus Krumholzibacteriota bacterium]